MHCICLISSSVARHAPSMRMFDVRIMHCISLSRSYSVYLLAFLSLYLSLCLSLSVSLSDPASFQIASLCAYVFHSHRFVRAALFDVFDEYV